MKCRRARKLVFEFVDGLTDETVRLDLEKHLAECAACDRLASQVTRSMDLIRRAPVETLDENFNWKVRLAIHKERHAMQEAMASQGALFRAWNTRYAVSAVAGFLAVIAVGWMGFSTGVIGIGGGAAVQPALVAGADQPAQSTTPQRANIRLEESPFIRTPVGSPVSQGVPPERHTVQRPGAISEAGETGMTRVDLDSLIQAEMSGRSTEERVRYLQNGARVFNHYLELYATEPSQESQ